LPGLLAELVKIQVTGRKERRKVQLAPSKLDSFEKNFLSSVCATLGSGFQAAGSRTRVLLCVALALAHNDRAPTEPGCKKYGNATRQGQTDAGPDRRQRLKAQLDEGAD